MKKLLALLVVCLALTVAACGGDDEDDGGGGGGTAAPAEQTDTAAPREDSPASVKVDIPDIKFEPKDIAVEAGTTITWTNTDDLPHTVTKTGGPGAQFDSGNIDPGGEYEQTVEAKGKIDYVCTIHPGQEGSITVE